MTYSTPVLLWIKKLNSLIYRTLVNIYGSYKLLKTVRFLAHSVFCGNFFIFVLAVYLLTMANTSQPITCCPQVRRGEGHVTTSNLGKKWQYLKSGTRFGTPFISSKLSQLESPKFYKHLGSVNYSFSDVKIFPLGGVSGVQHPLMQIWEPHHIPSYLRNCWSWKVEILRTLRQCQILIWGAKIFRNGGVPGAQRPIV